MSAALDIRAISFDLDDTLWPIAPVLERVDRRVQQWLQQHCAPVAHAWPSAAVQTLRRQVEQESPHLAHDLSALRRLTLQRMFTPFGMGADWVEATFAIYEHERNIVECYADAIPALQALATRLPLISISNGTADLTRIGLQQHFHFSISARELGMAKPDPRIFQHACAQLALPPAQVLHVGDDPITDVVGAHAAGLRTAWLNRNNDDWRGTPTPDLQLTDLGQLTHWLHAQPTH